MGSRVTAIFENLMAAASVAALLIVFRAARTRGVTACGESYLLYGRLAKLTIAREQATGQVTEERCTGSKIR
jgi:hypothetical protein